MSLFDDLEYVDITEFSGPNQLLDEEDISEPRALEAKNVEYVEGQVRVPRRGFAQVWNPAKAIRSMYHWLQYQYNRLVYLDSDNKVVARNVVAGTNLTVVDFGSTAPAGMTCVEAGYRIFMSFFNSLGAGMNETLVWDGGTYLGGNPVYDADVVPVFKAPLSVGPNTSYPYGNLANGSSGSGTAYGGGGTNVWATVVANTGGYVTAGFHYIGLIGTTRSGHRQYLGPLYTSTNTIAADLVNLTAAATVSVTITPKSGYSWPLWLLSVELAVTVEATGAGVNEARWFILPGSSTTPVRGSATAIVFTYNLSDETLVGEAEEITNTLLAQYRQDLSLKEVSVTATTLTSIVVVGNVGTIHFASAHGLTAVNMSGGYLSVSGSTTSALNAQYLQVYASPTTLTIITSGVADGTYNNAALTVRVNYFSTKIQPHKLLSLSNRNVYLARTPGPDNTSLIGTLAISEQFNPEYVLTATNLISLPEFRDCVTAFNIGNALYACGPSWTYAYTDNLREPVFWAPPRLVSGQVGSPFIHGVSVNQGKGYAWVCDHTGLYFFNGAAYSLLPSSYYQLGDWNRINFGAPANQLKVIESPDDRLVIVKAPLDGATSATHLLVWDYTLGVTAKQIRYCGLWSIADFPTIGDIETVQDAATLVKQFWISSLSNLDVRRLKSAGVGMANETGDAPLTITMSGGGGYITNIVVSANVATLTFTRDFGFYVGLAFTISGATVDADLNGAYIVASVTSGLVCTFATVNVANGTYTDAGLTITLTAANANSVLYSDSGAGIDGHYKMVCVSKGANSAQQQVGARIRARGARTLNVQASSFDQNTVVTCAPISLSPAPGQRYDRLYDMQSEVVSLKFYNNALAGAYAWISALRVYFHKWAAGR